MQVKDFIQIFLVLCKSDSQITLSSSVDTCHTRTQMSLTTWGTKSSLLRFTFQCCIVCKTQIHTCTTSCTATDFRWKSFTSIRMWKQFSSDKMRNASMHSNSSGNLLFSLTHLQVWGRTVIDLLKNCFLNKGARLQSSIKVTFPSPQDKHPQVLNTQPHAASSVKLKHTVHTDQVQKVHHAFSGPYLCPSV